MITDIIHTQLLACLIVNDQYAYPYYFLSKDGSINSKETKDKEASGNSIKSYWDSRSNLPQVSPVSLYFYPYYRTWQIVSNWKQNGAISLPPHSLDHWWLLTQGLKVSQSASRLCCSLQCWHPMGAVIWVLATLLPTQLPIGAPRKVVDGLSFWVSKLSHEGEMGFWAHGLGLAKIWFVICNMNI